MAVINQERRRFKRRHVIFYSRVFDRSNGKLLGYIIDISAIGFMLIHEEPIPLHKAYQLRIDLPEDVGAKSFLNFDAESLWSQPDINPAFRNTGFQIANMAPEDITLIESMVEEMGFRD